MASGNYALKTDLDTAVSTITNANTRLTSLENTTNTRMTTLERNINTSINTLDSRTFPPLSVIAFSSALGIPDGWQECDGANLKNDDNTTDAYILNTTSSSAQTMRTPDLRGRTIIGSGTGTGLTARTVGQTGGAETHQLTIEEMPPHGHVIPTIGSGPSTMQYGYAPYYNQLSGALGSGYTGGLNNGTDTKSHNNMQPFTVLRYIIKQPTGTTALKPYRIS